MEFGITSFRIPHSPFRNPHSVETTFLFLPNIFYLSRLCSYKQTFIQMVTLLNPAHKHFGLSSEEFQKMKTEFQQGDSPIFRRVCETQDVLLEFKKLAHSALNQVNRFDAHDKDGIALDCYIKWRDKVAKELHYKEFTRSYRNTLIYNYCTDLQNKKSPIFGYDDFIQEFGDKSSENNEHTLKEWIEKVAFGWKQLCERCRNLLERVDKKGERVDALAIELGITRPHLSTTLGDCRRKLVELSQLPPKIQDKKKYW